MTDFLKRRSNLSCDSPSLSFTFAKTIPPFKDFFVRYQGKQKKDLVVNQIPRSLHLSQTNDICSTGSTFPFSEFTH